jgi:polygalacturonase
MMTKSKKILTFGGLFILICIILFFSFNTKFRKNLLAVLGFKKEPVYLTYSVNAFPEQDKVIPPFEMPEIKQPIFPENVCNITEFGAIGDGVTMNTKAFSDAITDCVKKGGGKVVVPAGKWLTGPIKMQSNIHLEVGKDAEILFSTNLDDYLPVVFSRFEGIEYYNYSPPIYANDCTNIALTGEGKINGQGDVNWWKIAGNYTTEKLYEMGNKNTPVENRVFGKPEDGLRPSFIQFVNCKNILIDGPTFIKGPMWTVHPIYSHDIVIKNITILTDPGPNTDGIVLDSSKNILVENSTFDTGDDAIAIKSGRDQDGLRVNIPSENIVVRNSNIKNAHGAIAIGSEMSGGVRNIFAYNLSANHSEFGLRIKSAMGRGGIVENIWIQGLTMKNVMRDAIQITADYQEPFNPIINTELPLFRNIHIRDISCAKAKTTISLHGSPNSPVENIDFENFDTTSLNGVIINNSKNVTLKNININMESGPIFEFTNINTLASKNLTCPEKIENCVSIFGDNSKNIELNGPGISAKNVIAPNKSGIYTINAEKNK